MAARQPTQLHQQTSRIPHAERAESPDLTLIASLRAAPVPPDPTTAFVATVTPRHRCIPRYQRSAVSPAPTLPPVPLPLPAVPVTSSTTPTQEQPVALHFCYQCGAAVPPWRSDCFSHNRRYGCGMSSLVPLMPLGAPPIEVIIALPTTELAIIAPHRSEKVR